MKKPTGNARQINVNAVNDVQRKTHPAAPNSSPMRNRTKTEAAATRPPIARRKSP